MSPIKKIWPFIKKKINSVLLCRPSCSQQNPLKPTLAVLSGLGSSCGSPVWVSFHIGRDLLYSCSKAWKHLVFAACCALSLQFAAGHPGEADSSRVNCFYHKNKCFLSSLSSRDESAARNHTPSRAALVGRAAGRSSPPTPEMWKEEQGRQTGAWSDSCPMVLPKRITPQDSLGTHGSAPRFLPQNHHGQC